MPWSIDLIYFGVFMVIKAAVIRITPVSLNLFVANTSSSSIRERYPECCRIIGVYASVDFVYFRAAAADFVLECAG